MSGLSQSYLATGSYCFQPQSEEEARLIQQQLIRRGFRWQQGQREPLYLEILTKGTLKLNDGIMTYSSSRETSGKLLSYNSFDPDYIVDDREYLAKMFNKVFERMDAIEKRLAALEESVNPAPVDKPSLTRPAKPFGKN